MIRRQWTVAAFSSLALACTSAETGGTTEVDAAVALDGAHGSADSAPDAAAAVETIEADAAAPDVPPADPDVESADALETKTSEANDADEIAQSEDVANDTGVEVPADVPADVPDVPPPPPCFATATIIGPKQGDFVQRDASVLVSATVVDPNGGALDTFGVQWETESGLILATTPVLFDGSTVGSIAFPATGKHALSARPTQNGQACDAEPVAIEVHVCGHHLVEHFDQALDSTQWQVYGNAFWDSGGWLEMTDTYQGRRGAIFSANPQVAPGDVSFRFRFATGPSDSDGADGFAASIMKAKKLEEVTEAITLAEGGGGLGYGRGGPYGGWVGDAFTVEVDTWYNQKNDAEWHTDPTTLDHVEITSGLDPSASLVFHEIGNIEDLAWHSVRVDVSATRLTIWYDGALVVDQDVPDLKFRGGYVFFSGSTGYYYNYHRFDDLEILDACEPGAP